MYLMYRIFVGVTICSWVANSTLTLLFALWVKCTAYLYTSWCTHYELKCNFLTYYAWGDHLFNIVLKPSYLVKHYLFCFQISVSYFRAKHETYCFYLWHSFSLDSFINTSDINEQYPLQSGLELVFILYWFWSCNVWTGGGARGLHSHTYWIIRTNT